MLADAGVGLDLLFAIRAFPRAFARRKEDEREEDDQGDDREKRAADK